MGQPGFFSVACPKDKWLLLDPRGRPVFLRGANHYGDGTCMPWNLKARHGSREAWRRELRDRHRQWGFNYLAPSIGPSAVDPAVAAEDGSGRKVLGRRTPEWPAAHFAELDFPFAFLLEVPRQNMHPGPAYPDVFSSEFRQAVEQRCREQAAPLRDNPNLVGYHFCHNPPWHASLPGFGQWVRDSLRPGSAGRREWIRLMHRVYGSVERWRATYGLPIRSWDDIEGLADPLRGYVSHGRMLEDQAAFMERICEQWHRVYVESIRRHDPNHLILGDRNTLHLQPLPAYAVGIMRRWLDVLSVNVMGPPDTAYGVLEQATRHWDGPVLLADTGASPPREGGAASGYATRDAAEYEAIWRGLMEMGLQHPQIVGFGWCGYYDTPAPSPRSGLVDCRTDEPIAERVAVAAKWNAWMEGEFGRLTARAGD